MSIRQNCDAIASRSRCPVRETCSLFGLHGSTPLRAHPGSTRGRSCGVPAPLRGRLVPPHDGVRGSEWIHLSRALGRTDARVSSVSPAPVVPAGTSSTLEELGVRCCCVGLRPPWRVRQTSGSPFRRATYDAARSPACGRQPQAPSACPGAWPRPIPKPSATTIEPASR